jgi:hypothetical protein
MLRICKCRGHSPPLPPPAPSSPRPPPPHSLPPCQRQKTTSATLCTNKFCARAALTTLLRGVCLAHVAVCVKSRKESWSTVEVAHTKFFSKTRKRFTREDYKTRAQLMDMYRSEDFSGQLGVLTLESGLEKTVHAYFCAEPYTGTFAAGRVGGPACAPQNPVGLNLLSFLAAEGALGECVSGPVGLWKWF